jgi:dTDP-4-dehydrorhamnose reductase
MNFFNKNNLTLITGSTGMVGSAVVRLLKDKRCQNFLMPNSQELDLCDRQQVDAYFSKYTLTGNRFNIFKRLKAQSQQRIQS